MRGQLPQLEAIKDKEGLGEPSVKVGKGKSPGVRLPGYHHL